MKYHYIQWVSQIALHNNIWILKGKRFLPFLVPTSANHVCSLPHIINTWPPWYCTWYQINDTIYLQISRMPQTNTFTIFWGSPSLRILWGSLPYVLCTCEDIIHIVLYSAETNSNFYYSNIWYQNKWISDYSFLQLHPKINWL